jgi:SAM-dependent methyltransferase
MKITYQEVESFDGGSFSSFIEELVVQHASKRICEVGPGAKPSLSQEAVRNYGLHYSVIDQYGWEVGKAGVAEAQVVDICAKNAALPGKPYDMMINRAVAEHFRDSANAYQNMFGWLAPGGLCVSTFSTLYSLPLLLNRILPTSISDLLLDHFAPRDRANHDKFKAY